MASTTIMIFSLISLATYHFFYLTKLSQLKAGVELQYGDVQNKAHLEADNFRVQTSVDFKY